MRITCNRTARLWTACASVLFIVTGCQRHASRGASRGTPRATPRPDSVSATWVNEGGDKVTKDELRATHGGPEAVLSSVWDGKMVSLFGARNETVSFNVVLESITGAHGVSVSLPALSGPNQAAIASRSVSRDGLFDWRDRNIELFYVRYLAIKGLSRLAYETYDERHIPHRFRRPFNSEGDGRGAWLDRPDHDKLYPDIAVPLELHAAFDIPPQSNQSIWVDIYVPKTAPAGLYRGTLDVFYADGSVARSLPVQLQVRDFALPDVSRAKVFLFLSDENVDHRYVGRPYPDTEAELRKSLLVRDRHFMVARRHRVDLIGDRPSTKDQPHRDWLPRLDGSLFTAATGYAGPGVAMPNSVFSIGTYGSWSWRKRGRRAMWRHTNRWVTWFDTHAPGIDYFLYLVDESQDYPQIETWAQWIDSNPGPGSRMYGMATLPAPQGRARTPSLDLVASCDSIGRRDVWRQAVSGLQRQRDRRFYYYNGGRPGVGSHATEDDGVALRQKAWSQYKLEIERWFSWDSTYYNNYQGEEGETNVFERAQTFGSFSGRDPVLGETGWNYTNGDGVLFYPGTDKVYPEASYDVLGPFASLRLKHWRRGIQDVEYLVLAAKKNPQRVASIVDALIPKVLWEYDVNAPDDPTWVRTDISWPTDPDRWEAARRELADIIEGRSTARTRQKPVERDKTRPRRR